MAERTNIPTSPACGQWETLLADALDGLLRPEDEATFSNHMATCVACTALFEEARRGREWLDFLSVEPEVPAGLLDRILAQTGPGQTAELSVAAGEGAMMTAGVPLQKARARSVRVPAWQKPGFMGYVRRFAEPRLMMTAAMAFFSIALTLNMTGVHITKLRVADLKPTSIRMYMQRQITVAYTPIVRYYDHLRLVYEVQSRVREMRRNNQTESDQQKTQQPSGESKQNPNHKEGGSRVSPPQQSVTPALNSVDLLETSLSLHDLPAHSGTPQGHGCVLRGSVGGSGKEEEKGAAYGLRKS
jgi:Putative zinc-finger